MRPSQKWGEYRRPIKHTGVKRGLTLLRNVMALLCPIGPPICLAYVH